MSRQVDFVLALSSFGERPALCDDSGTSLSYTALTEAIDSTTTAWRELIPVERPLIMLECRQSITTVINYLTCLANQWPVMMVNEQVGTAARDELRHRLPPHLVVTDTRCHAEHTAVHDMDPRLAVLLSTSGSTGGGKWVALSHDNINANTTSILAYLPIAQEDNALASLPFSYSYGLSVLHTHLAKGAQLTLTQRSPMERDFWHLLSEAQITSLAGVPHWYEMLARLGFCRKAFPSLRYMTQAGGRLQSRFVKEFARYADNHDMALYIMYGQTEATARMAYLSPDKALTKPEAIGQAIPGGEFALRDEAGELVTCSGVAGELCFKGKNVMLGYVHSVDDLATFTPPDWLETGDIACRDDEGDYHVVGRKARFIKLFGERVNLDGLEGLLANAGLDVKCYGQDNALTVCCLTGQASMAGEAVKAYVNCPPKAVRIAEVDAWPLLSNGKTDYRVLASCTASQGEGAHD
ncbi:AMP-binding protein [Alteromonas sp. CYL-A6]|uniref:AMP-binding protein n=1 Tax=Alteromonas nitratireducens TaxID=3390813 RepID=UPI0034AB10AB